MPMIYLPHGYAEFDSDDLVKHISRLLKNHCNEAVYSL